MANRQALQELQTRLADRLRTATARQDDSGSWLGVESGEVKYLFPLGQAGELFPYVSPHPVPYSKEWFVGVANLRGGLWGVADLAGFLSGQSSSDEHLSKGCLICLNPAFEVNCALLVDRLLGLKNTTSFNEFSQRALEEPSFMGGSYIDPHGMTWKELDLQMLARNIGFLTIAAEGSALSLESLHGPD